MPSTAILSQGSTFEIDTTGAGNFAKVSNLRTFTGFDGSAANIDVSNMDSVAKEFLIGLKDSGNFTVETDQDNSDAGQQALLAAQHAQAKRNFRLTLPDGAVATFAGYAKKVSTAGGVDQAVKRQIEILITGDVTWA